MLLVVLEVCTSVLMMVLTLDTGSMRGVGSVLPLPPEVSAERESLEAVSGWRTEDWSVAGGDFLGDFLW